MNFDNFPYLANEEIVCSKIRTKHPQISSATYPKIDKNVLKSAKNENISRILERWISINYSSATSSSGEL